METMSYKGVLSEGRVLDSFDGLEAFLRGVERRAYRMAEMATGNPEDALDIVQDAMMKLTRSYAHKPPEQWGPLFHRILQSRITDWHRRTNLRRKWRVWLKGGARESEEADPIQALEDPHGITPEARLDFDDAGDAVTAAVAALPLRQRQAFMLRIWEGLNVAAAADAMGCSEGSVKTHLSRAVQALRAQLEDYRP